MTFKIGDQVTRNSYNNDTIFVITDIVDDICYLNGVNIRLSADSPISDLKAADDTNDIEKENDFISRLNPEPLEARKLESSHEKLIIIAGGCQSNYEELIKAGANFASSPKRINIHALDPAIIAAKLSLADITKDIDLKGILENTKYGPSGIGGIKTKGTMYVGYPR